MAVAVVLQEFHNLLVRVGDDATHLVDDELLRLRRKLRAARERAARPVTRQEGLDHLAEALLEHETLDEDDAYAAAGVAYAAAAPAEALAVAARSMTERSLSLTFELFGSGR